MIAFTFKGKATKPGGSSVTANSTQELLWGIERHVRLMAKIVGRCEDCGATLALTDEDRHTIGEVLTAAAEGIAQTNGGLTNEHHQARGKGR